ncbi:MAG: chemotaxis protein CheB [Deltaproteobacteria bacterium]|nr:MAG: chemotaxis protein CheB [Deltaproteobacteria bacterium]
MKRRVFVVDDSPICRAQLRDWLEADGDVEVVGEAADGESAIDSIGRLHPDVATIDLRLPGMSGLEVVTLVMAKSPLPMLILTGDPTADDPGIAFEAIRRGALDLLLKPSMDDDEAIRALRSHVRWLANVPVVRHLDGHRPEPVRQDGPRAEPASRSPARVVRKANDPVIVGIAASAGGPSALATVLGALSTDLPICLAIVQHLPRGFAASFVSFLQARCSLTVRLAEHGMEPRPATVVLAPDDHHLELIDGRFALTSGPPVEGHRPSATVLLRSLAALRGAAIGVVLSGIGRDGADGLRAMRDHHALTFAQDASSSVVYGMPRAAVEEGAVLRSLPVAELGDAIAAAVRNARRGWWS